METTQINIAGKLKDCPKGTKLYSPIFGEVVFDHIHNKEIIVYLKNAIPRCFSYYGQYLCSTSITDGECMLFPSKDNRDWSTFQAPKPKHEFKPFERVLGRDLDVEEWRADFFSHLRDGNDMVYYVCVGLVYKQCIPYEGNEYLLGTTNSPDEKGGEE